MFNYFKVFTKAGWNQVLSGSASLFSFFSFFWFLHDVRIEFNDDVSEHTVGLHWSLIIEGGTHSEFRNVVS